MLGVDYRLIQGEGRRIGRISDKVDTQTLEVPVSLKRNSNKKQLQYLEPVNNYAIRIKYLISDSCQPLILSV